MPSLFFVYTTHAFCQVIDPEIQVSPEEQAILDSLDQAIKNFTDNLLAEGEKQASVGQQTSGKAREKRQEEMFPLKAPSNMGPGSERLMEELAKALDENAKNIAQRARKMQGKDETDN